MADKIYVGKGKIFGQYGSLKISINVNDMQGNRIVNPNEKGWINLIVNKMREPDKHGNEYTVLLDTFVPTKSEKPISDNPCIPTTQDDSDLPF